MVRVCCEVSFDEGASIVDQDVKPTEPIGDRFQHGDSRLTDSHVGLDG
jgi:hypothetical protein